jgi:hypothetical protein
MIQVNLLKNAAMLSGNLLTPMLGEISIGVSKFPTYLIGN